MTRKQTFESEEDWIYNSEYEEGTPVVVYPVIVTGIGCFVIGVMLGVMI